MFPLFASSIFSLGVKVASAGLTYIMFVFMARAMSIYEFGKFSVGFTLATFLAILASCGVHVGINRWWPEYIATDKPGLAIKSFYWGLRTTSVAAAGLGALLACGAIYVLPDTGKAENYLLATAILILPMALSDYFANALRAQGSLVWAQLPKDVLWRVTGCGAVLCAAHWKLSLTSTVALLVLASALGVLVLIQFAAAMVPVRQLTKLTAAEEENHGEARTSWIATSWPIWAGAVLNAMVQNVDVLLVSTMISVEKSAEYFAAVKTVSLLGLMHVAATLVLAPLISQNVYSGNKKKLQTMFQSIAVLNLVATILFSTILIFYGQFLLSLFGTQFVQSYRAFLVLLVGFIGNALCGSVGYLLMLTGFERVYLKILTISYVISLGIQILLIPSFGSIGAAIGSSLSLIIAGIWSRAVAVDKLGLDPTAASIFRRRPVGEFT